MRSGVLRSSGGRTVWSKYSQTLFVFVLVAFFLLTASVSGGNGSQSGSNRSRSKSFRGGGRTVTAMSAPGGNFLRGTTFASVPAMLYGTAWKKEKTAGLVETALKAGFRGIDTACQPKHYNEPGVGEGIARAISAGVVTRSQLFIQTKFTSLSGQDPNNLPYSKEVPLSEQVRQSLQVSLRNLKTDYLDSWVLHSPMKTFEKTMQVWGEFEKAVTEGTVKRLGISNCYDLGTLRQLYDAANVKPSFLQNRFYRESNYDREIRAFCLEKGIKYQTFWTLTANPNVLASPQVKKIASSIGKTREQIWFSFILSQNAMFLTGTTSEKHMAEDLEVPSIELSRADVESLAALIE